VTSLLEDILTTAEIRRLIAKLIFAAQSHPAFIWAWSRWRQAHQALAAFYHRKKRLQMQL